MSRCTRVRLLPHIANFQASISNSLISSLNIGPSLLAQACLSAHYGIQGFEASESLSNPGAAIRDEILIEKHRLGDILGIGSPLRMRTLITQDSGLSIYQHYADVDLFDLKNDPDEMVNKKAIGDSNP